MSTKISDEEPHNELIAYLRIDLRFNK